MAFDAGMLSCVLSELRALALGARVEKVFQPEHDEIVLQIRSREGGKRLLISAGAGNPRISFTEEQKENPMTPPMLCMLLRKHLQGAKLSDIQMQGFERVAFLGFETRDEMGFPCKKYLIAEILGKYSNLIFTDEKQKILSVLHPVDFSTSEKRQLLPGMTYEMPPSQGKTDPTTVSEETLDALFEGSDKPVDKWLVSTFCGVSPAVAREIAYRALGKTDIPLSLCNRAALKKTFLAFFEDIREERFAPSMVRDRGMPVEYAFCNLSHYGKHFEVISYESISGLLDDFFRTRDRERHLKNKASDILRILSAADNRIRKKLELQRGELADCEKGSEYKKYADLITANLYALSRGMSRVELTDYEDYREDGSYGSVAITLDSRLSPAANAQIYYKKYNKAKTARIELSRQIERGEEELSYIDSVLDSLAHAETAADLFEIRDELAHAGYASKMKHYSAPSKKKAPVVAEFLTRNGYRVLCGKNNVQNEYITHKLAGKNDYWFHVKNLPGSHTVMLCGGTEPPEGDFTDAAEIAAFFSKGVGGENVEVDYTFVRNVKKPAGGKPGKVIYHTNWSCIVTPDENRVKSMRKQ